MAIKAAIKPIPKSYSFEDFLVQKNILTADQLNRAKTESATNQKNLYDYLVSERYITEEKLAEARGLFFKLPYVDLKNRIVSKDILDMVSRETINNYRFLPFELTKDGLKVGLTDPTNLAALEALEFLSQKRRSEE